MYHSTTTNCWRTSTDQLWAPLVVRLWRTLSLPCHDGDHLVWGDADAFWTSVLLSCLCHHFHFPLLLRLCKVLGIDPVDVLVLLLLHLLLGAALLLLPLLLLNQPPLLLPPREHWCHCHLHILDQDCETDRDEKESGHDSGTRWDAAQLS